MDGTMNVLLLSRILQTVAYVGLFFFSLIQLKEPKGKRVAITTGIYIVVAMAYYVSTSVYGQSVAERLILPVIIGLSVTLLAICSADKWPVSLFVLLTQFNLYFGISYVSDIFTINDTGTMYQIEYLAYRTVLFGGVLFFNFKYLRPHFRKLVVILDKEWHLITLTAFFFFILEAVIMYYPRLYWHEPDNRWHLVASSYLMFFGLYWLIFKSIGTIVERYEGHERESILTLQNKMWEEHIDDLKHAVNVARRDRHDLRHHYDTLLGMISTGKTNEAVSYLNAQTQRMEGAMFVDVCEHPAANAILSRWASRARSHGIKTEMDVRIPENLPMDEVVLVGILANAFENAVEGCLRLTEGMERKIVMKVAYSVHNGAKKFHMVVENSCVDHIVFENGFPRSQKSGGGTGTRSIGYAAERYKGMVEFSAVDGVFRTRVLLHL